MNGKRARIREANCQMPIAHCLYCHLLLANCQISLPIPPPQGSRSQVLWEARSQSDILERIVWPIFGAKCPLIGPSCPFKWPSCPKISKYRAKMTPRSLNLEPRCLSDPNLKDFGTNFEGFGAHVGFQTASKTGAHLTIDQSLNFDSRVGGNQKNKLLTC